MTAVAGIDLSTHTIDLVRLDEDSNEGDWFRFHLSGATAWDRAMTVREALPPDDFWDDVYLVAIETAFPDQNHVVRLVQGALLTALPRRLRQPHTCWEANQATWKKAHGLKQKPTWADMYDVADGWRLKWSEFPSRWDGFATQPLESFTGPQYQNGRDAYCIALWARETNRRGIEAA